jgi:hypothetical protein
MVAVLLGVVVGVAPEQQVLRRKDCACARTGWQVLGHCKSLARMASFVILKAMLLQKLVRSVERVVPGLRVEVGQVRGKGAIVLLPKPQISTATTAVLPACKHPSRRQRSCVILEAIADRQASRVLRWRAGIGGSRANATAPGEGAVG